MILGMYRINKILDNTLFRLKIDYEIRGKTANGGLLGAKAIDIFLGSNEQHLSKIWIMFDFWAEGPLVVSGLRVDVIEVMMHVICYLYDEMEWFLYFLEK